MSISHMINLAINRSFEYGASQYTNNNINSVFIRTLAFQIVPHYSRLYQYTKTEFFDVDNVSHHDSINHHGTATPIFKLKSDSADDNRAKVYKELRKIFGYHTISQLLSDRKISEDMIEKLESLVTVLNGSEGVMYDMGFRFQQNVVNDYRG